MTLIIIAIVLYIISGVITFGATFANFQRQFPTLAAENRREDIGISVFAAVIPVVGFFVCLLLSGFYKYGLKFRMNDE